MNFEPTDTVRGNKWKSEIYFNWRASEASETLSGVTNGNRRYIYIYGTCKTL